MEEWKEYKISGVIDEISMGPFGSNIKVDNFIDFGVPVLNGSNLQGFKLQEESFNYVSQEKADSLGKANAHRGDVVITHRGTLGQIVYIPQDSKFEQYVISQSQFRLKLKQDLIRPDFFVYFFHTPIGQHRILMNASQVGVPALARPTTTFKEVFVPVPPLETQNAIMAILSSLDKKIEVNKWLNDNFTLSFLFLTCFVLWLLKLINDNLEQLAQTVLKNWKEQVKQRAHYSTKLETIALFVGGYSYKGKELKPSKKAMATIKNFDRNGGFKLDGYKEIEPSDKVKPGQFVNMFDILVAHTDLTQNAEVIGNAEMVLSFDGYERIVFSMDLVKVIPQDVFPFKFLLAALLRDSDFKSHCMGYVNGTTVLHMSKKALPEFEVLLPKDQSSICQIDTYLSNIYRKMAEIVSESSHLSTLRDTLLPQLMSGELIINELTM